MLTTAVVTQSNYLPWKGYIDHITFGREFVIGAGVLLLEDAPDQAVYAAAGTEKARVPSNRLRNL